MTKIVDAEGKPIQTRHIPTVHYKDFMFPVDLVRDEERVDVSSKKIGALSVIKELRATNRELQHRFALVAAALAIASKKDPDLKEYIDAIGLKITDANGKVFYDPTK